MITLFIISIDKMFFMYFSINRDAKGDKVKTKGSKCELSVENMSK